MFLKDLLGFKTDFDALDISKISHDENEPGDVYFCLTSDEDKSWQRCKKAILNGAKIVISNFDLPFSNSVKVENVRKVFADSCANFYEHPTDRLKMIGVTGTNGKTTTTFVIREILGRNGKQCGVIGTNGVFYCGKKFPSPLTTPDSDFLQKTFKDMADAGCEYVAMEVSAHAIDQLRTDGIMFDVGVLTNVTQDHLDYFKDFENYKRTKFSFFTPEHVKSAVVCSDDPVSREILENIKVPVKTYGFKNPSDNFAINMCCSMDGTHFTANINDKVCDINTNLMGEYNIENCLAALSVCEKFGLDEKELSQGLNYMLPVEGRFNVINYCGKYVVIDFAHSPDSLKNVLQTVRSLTDQNVYVVFGCGGNRDRDKRHKMGAIAEKYADFVCLTDDNPRLEKSEDIINDIESGMKNPHFVQPDRALAIKNMIDVAKPGDIIVVAGKGAEKYQEVGTEKRPYNDFDVVYNLFKDSDPLKNRGKGYGD